MCVKDGLFPILDRDTGHGYWVNDVGRYWEADPVLVTSYALIALQIAMP